MWHNALGLSHGAAGPALHGAADALQCPGLPISPCPAVAGSLKCLAALQRRSVAPLVSVCAACLAPCVPWHTRHHRPAPGAEGNAHALLAFLTGSEEVPDSTRRWPAWRHRLAPRIVLALAGRWLGAGPAPQLRSAVDAAAEAAEEADGEPIAGAGGEAAGAAAGTDNVPPAGDAAAPGHAAAEAADPRSGTSLAACGGGGCGDEPPSCRPSQLPQEQRQQRGAEAGLRGAMAAAAAAAAAQHHQRPEQAQVAAKENRQANDSAAAKPGGCAPKAAVAAHGTAATLRGGRERKASTRFAEFLTGEAEACIEFALNDA